MLPQSLGKVKILGKYYLAVTTRENIGVLSYIHTAIQSSTMKKQKFNYMFSGLLPWLILSLLYQWREVMFVLSYEAPHFWHLVLQGFLFTVSTLRKKIMLCSLSPLPRLPRCFWLSFWAPSVSHIDTKPHARCGRRAQHTLLLLTCNPVVLSEDEYWRHFRICVKL